MLCSKRGSDSNFSRVWQEMGASQKCPAASSYQLWQVHYQFQITDASTPCWAHLARWVLLCKGEHHLQGERVAAGVLHSAGYGGSSTQMQSLLCECRMWLWISSELKVTWDAVLKTWPGREQRRCWLQTYPAFLENSTHGDSGFIVQWE